MKIIKIHTEQKLKYKQPKKYELLLVLSLDVFHSAVREMHKYNVFSPQNSPVIEQFGFNKIALFSFSVGLGWSTCVEARIQNLPQSALGKLPNITKIQDGRHYSIQNH